MWNTIKEILVILTPVFLGLIGLRSLVLQNENLKISKEAKEKVEENTQITKDTIGKVDENTKVTTYVKEVLDDVHTQINGVKDELVEATKKLGESVGKEVGKKEQLAEQVIATNLEAAKAQGIIEGKQALKEEGKQALKEETSPVKVEVVNEPIQVVTHKPKGDKSTPE